ncbi:hypothetical protein E2542_SST17837 [Spatholobus suberectus]|nr:hypothetical protein E2542_SST17837 [Spatholobus suberectus]
MKLFLDSWPISVSDLWLLFGKVPSKDIYAKKGYFKAYFFSENKKRKCEMLCLKQIDIIYRVLVMLSRYVWVEEYEVKL